MRLIDADELKKKKRFFHVEEYGEEAVTVEDIDNALTVDHVKHGKWIDRTGPDEDLNVTDTCSVCLHTDTHSPTVDIPYCWHCGSKMDL